MMMATATMAWPSSGAPLAMSSPPPQKEIPGSYGPPLLGSLKDRLNYSWFQRQDGFFRRKMEAHNSTVFRTNLPPSWPFFSVDPRTIALLDIRSFSTLFDLSVVEKKDVLVGNYMPDVKFTGNKRVVVYLDTEEPGHAEIKSFSLEVLKRSAQTWVDSFMKYSDEMWATVERDYKKKGCAPLMLPLQKCIFGFLCASITGADPEVDKTIKEYGFVMLDRWLMMQLMPVANMDAVPQPIGELFFHSFTYPHFLVAKDYKKLFDFVKKEGGDVVGLAKNFGLDEERAIHNILFVLGFNAFGGFSIFFPALFLSIGKGKGKGGLQMRLREDVRRVVGDGKKPIGFEAVKEMDLVRSTVYEVLRLNPPVVLQYGRARKDFVLESHKASYNVKKGELMCGYQPLAMRDPNVFENPEEFMPERFMAAGGGERKDLLKYLYWSNGPQTDEPSPHNKQCAAKEHVVVTACMMIAQIFTKYDSFELDDLLNVKSLVKRSDV